MKKIIISVLVTMIVVCPATIVVMNLLNKETPTKEKPIDEIKALTKGVISEEKLDSYELPKNINIQISGLYDGHVGEEFLSDLTKYRIKAVVETDIGPVEREYVGIKLKDVQEKLEVSGFNGISIRHSRLIKKNIAAEEVDEHYYLTFEQDGKKYINDVKVNVVDLDDNQGLNVTGVSQLYYYNVEDAVK